MYRLIVNILIIVLALLPSSSIIAKEMLPDNYQPPKIYECHVNKGQTFTIIDDDDITYYILSSDFTNIVSRDGNRVTFNTDKTGTHVFMVHEADKKAYYYWYIKVDDEPGYTDKELVIHGDQFIWQKKALSEVITVNKQDYAQDVLDLVNIERRKEGLKPLKLSAELMEAADVRAEEITRVLSHKRPNGEPCGTAVKSGKYGIGENIAAGVATPVEVVRGWMNSPGHRANILRAAYEELGVGYVYKEHTVYKHYWIQMFREYH